jgi:hypothetical protein
MRTHGQRKTAHRIGRLAVLLALVVAMARMPRSMAAPQLDNAFPEGGALSASCGEPAVSSAPAMVACDNGGEGATSCETRHVISIGGIGTVSGCGISCTNGYYACCQDPTVTKRAECSCRHDPPPGPWTPELPW